MAGRPVVIECAELSKEEEASMAQQPKPLFQTAESSAVLQLSESPPAWVRILAEGRLVPWAFAQLERPRPT